mmetsp:Transcript_40445/g.116821  ORF Transcript_40445/g.116821 Transcript_40445/m.116821 type:complete len:265 (+) Transcript_40445:648-1442(+)
MVVTVEVGVVDVRVLVVVVAVVVVGVVVVAVVVVVVLEVLVVVTVLVVPVMVLVLDVAVTVVTVSVSVTVVVVMDVEVVVMVCVVVEMVVVVVVVVAAVVGWPTCDTLPLGILSAGVALSADAIAGAPFIAFSLICSITVVDVVGNPGSITAGGNAGGDDHTTLMSVTVTRPLVNSPMPRISSTHAATVPLSDVEELRRDRTKLRIMLLVGVTEACTNTTCGAISERIRLTPLTGVAYPDSKAIASFTCALNSWSMAGSFERRW